MKEKKKSANWYIAATHYITAGFAMPVLIDLIVFALHPLVKLESAVLIFLFDLMLTILAVWLGVMYSARYLSKTYIIENKDGIISSSTMYLVVLNTGYNLTQIFTGNLAGINIMYNFIRLVAIVILFYISSKKYIQNTEIVQSQTQ